MLKMGVIGWGGMGHFHHRTVRDKIARMETKGVYDINPAKKDDILEHGLIAYESADALLQDPEIDLVLVSTPNNFHKE